MVKSVKSQPFYMTVVLALRMAPSIKAAARKRGWTLKYFSANDMTDAYIELKPSESHIQVGRGTASLVRIGTGYRMEFWPNRSNVAGIVADVLEMIKETK